MVINIVRVKHGKVIRILTIYSRLVEGEIVNKKEMGEKFNVTEKTIQRDLEDIRAYFSENIEELGLKNIVYRRHQKGYLLENSEDVLTKEGILVILKILLESRAFCKRELEHLTNSILKQTNTNQRKNIKDIIGNELLNYAPLQHKELLLSKIWELSELIRNSEKIEITYIKMDGNEVKRIIKPVSIIFSEYYFYLIAYFNDFESPTIFRIDKIKEYKMIGEKFRIYNKERFEDGEFRKRIQFMYAGKLKKIKFEFTGPSIEAVLDRLPTAQIIDHSNDKYIVEAEVYGKGIIMWILSQGENIKVISPKVIVDEIVSELNKMRQNYKTQEQI